VGNKCDLQGVVGYEHASKVAGKKGISLFEVSAKTDKNVEQAFVAMMSERLKEASDSSKNHSQSDAS